MFQSVRKQGKTSSPVIDIAPLIDIVFILLIFFLVTATFVTDSGVKVTRPQASASESLESSSFRVSVAASGNIYVEGHQLDLLELRQKASTFFQKSDHHSAVVIPDETLPAGALVKVIDTLKLAHAKNIAIATRKN